jgi:voltage-gated potassium channel
MEIKHKLFWIALMLVALLSTGTLGYIFIEGWRPLDALYMTVITVATIGYGELKPLSDAGREFTMAIIVMGVGFFAYSINVLTEAAVEGRIKDIFNQRRMQKAISKLENHFIICGCGRIGRTILEMLLREGIPAVVIESNATVISELEEAGYLVIVGDATSEEVLQHAGISRARGIVCVLQSDADNVYITLTARLLNPSVFIIARASDRKAERRIYQAGANKVISPYEIGARRMGMAILKPTVIEFLDLAVHSADFDLSVEQYEIGDSSVLVGRTLKEIGIRERTGATLLTVKRKADAVMSSVHPDYVFQKGDLVVVLGSSESLNKFSAMVSG